MKMRMLLKKTVPMKMQMKMKTESDPAVEWGGDWG